MNAHAARFERLDALRAVAIVWMAVFHFCFDLNHFGLFTPRQHFLADPFWTLQRTCIVSLFLFCAGLSQAVALHAGQSWPRFWRRWLQIAACAAAVSIGFGVLHGIAVMLICARLAAPLRAWLWPLGALAIALPLLFRHPVFDPPWFSWLGLVVKKPVTEDYVPLLPWLGVMWWGLAAGQLLLARRPAVLAAAVPRALKPMATLGRWSLSFYMLHQPVLIGLLMLYQALT
jgi:uncharacterized membrane protein